MKIHKIKIQNMKSVSLSEVEMSGASIIVTAGNGKGKTTLLRSFFDRILESKNDKILKHGEEKGLYSIEFTDGNRVEWEFSEKSEKLTLITDSGLKVNSINQIKQFFFGKDSFDIDEFLQMSSVVFFVNLIMRGEKFHLFFLSFW